MLSWLPTGPLWRLAERSVLWPTLLMVIALPVVTWVIRRRASAAVSARAVVFMVVVLLAFAGIDPAWAFPPRQPLDFLPLFAGVAGVGDRILHLRHQPTRRRLLFLFLILTGTVATLMAPLLLSQLILVLGTAALSGMIGSASWLLLEQIDKKVAPTGMLPLVSIAAANLVIAPWTGSLLLGELGGSLAASLAVWMLWAYPSRLPLTSVGDGVRGFTVVFLSGLLLMEGVYSATPVDLLATLLAAVPLTALLTHFLGRRPLRPARFLLAVACAAALPAVIAILMAHGIYVAQGGY